MNQRFLALASLSLAALLTAPLVADGPRPLKVDDIFALKSVSDPRISPDGLWVAYTVRWLDPKEDSADADIYMLPIGGGTPLRLTSSPKAETRPRFSPDGRWLAFLSGRDGKHSQVWLLDRRGGEAVKLTDYKADVSDLVWSPDGKRLALAVGDVDPDEHDDDKAESAGHGGADKTPKPIVIHRLQFKRDGEGYLRELRQHLYVYDVEAKSSVQITSGPYEDSDPAWSPDGRWLAFTSNRTQEPDANDNSDVFVVEAKAGQKPRAVTTSPGTDRSPVFTPDGKSIVYLAGGDPKDIWYATNSVAVVQVAGGAPRLLTQSLDRNVELPRVSPDGKLIYFLLEEGGNEHLARVPIAGGPVERTVDGERAVQTYDVGPKGELVVLESTPQRPSEISVVAGGTLRPLSHVNDDFLKGIRLGAVQRIQATSA
ncbi:MAG TPA: S9 family peptidase, partial [Thermoanaerobaculia bacterium]|nr:S9 family peptidase [Thermoanaerobaculia bacterium]